MSEQGFNGALAQRWLQISVWGGVEITGKGEPWHMKKDYSILYHLGVRPMLVRMPDIPCVFGVTDIKRL